MQGYFTNFIAGGDPNGAGLPAFGGYGLETAAGVGSEMEFGLDYTRMRLDDLPLDRCGWWQRGLYA